MKAHLGTILLILFVSLMVFYFVRMPEPTGAVTKQSVCAAAGETIVVPCIAQGAQDYAREVLSENYKCAYSICNLERENILPAPCNIKITLECANQQQSAQFTQYCLNAFLGVCG